MFDCNTSISGEYTLYDENMNELCKSTNLITDWGMRRFVGDRSTGAPHPADTDISQQAFVNNMRFISLGVGSTGFGSEQTTDYNLVSAIPASDYTEFNVSATTGTTLSADPSGNLAIIFTRLTQFNMGAAFSLGGLGLTQYVINEIGCSWTTSSSFASNNRYGIFSRSTLQDPVIVRPNGRVYARYVLTIITDANKVKENMVHFAGTGASSFPLNKTTIKDLPLYTLKSDGNPLNIINGGSTAAFSSTVPLLEDAGNHNGTYTGVTRTGTQSSILGTSKRHWWLQFYTSAWPATNSDRDGGSNPQQRYDTFVSTASTNLNDGFTFHHSQICTLSNASCNLSTKNYNVANFGATAYDTTVNQNLSLLAGNLSYTGRKVNDTETLTQPTANTWTRQFRFLFTPNQIKTGTTVLKLYRTPLGDWTNGGGAYSCSYGRSCDGTVIFLDSSAQHTYGIVTVFNTDYNPNQALYTGFEYNFTYTRG
jgi:hypothetical protein